MSRKIITVTNPNGVKRIIVSQASNHQVVDTLSNKEIRRPKPIIGKAGTTSTKTAYKFGGKVNVGKRKI